MVDVDPTRENILSCRADVASVRRRGAREAGMRARIASLERWKTWWTTSETFHDALRATKGRRWTSWMASTKVSAGQEGTKTSGSIVTRTPKRGEDGRETHTNGPNEYRDRLSAADGSSGSRTDAWKDWFLDCPPVSITNGEVEPTALQWARRRGPDVPEGLLWKIFRKRSARTVNHEGKLKRVGAGDPLPPGSVLLLPRSSIEESHHQMTRHKSTKHTEITQAQKKWALSMLLHVEKDFLVLNKPSGMPVQGGTKVVLSIDQLLEPVFRLQESDKPRLVHRLDKDTSGCLLVARNPDAAAWISAAFRQRTKEAHRRRYQANGERPRLYVERTYWAVCEKRDKGTELSNAGLIDMPLRMVGGEKGKQKMVAALKEAGSTEDGLHAASSFRLLKGKDGLSVLKLWPHTGRKHQLRVHCSSGLDAPIVGDKKYGWSLLKTSSLLPKHPKLHLHCRKIKLRCPDGKEVEVTSPFPVHMQKTLSMLGLGTFDA